MNARLSPTLVMTLALSLGACVVAEASGVDAAQQHWDEAKRFLKQGAYRDALQSLDIILTQTPNDPWAQLYHSLCDLRMQSTASFSRLSPAQLAALQEALRLEERAQRRAGVQQKSLERQIRKEQAKWDKELEAIARQAEREETLMRHMVQTEALRQARAQRGQRRELAQAQALSASAQPQPATTVAPALETQPEVVAQPPQVPDTGAAVRAEPEVPVLERSVELGRVVVPTTVAEPTSQEPTSPSLVGHPAPPAGAVQINAQQMSVSPNRKIALADGDVEVVFENALLTCDHMTLFTDTKDVYAEGRVRLEQGNQVFRGEMAHYNFETKKGRFLQGTISSPPWHEHGRSAEHIAEGVYEVTPGYLTSCELEPPHFKFSGRRAIVFAGDRLARMRNVALVVDQVPFLYLPWLTFADRQTPFFLVPGKNKPWGAFALSGYRYELPGPVSQKGTLKMDWRRNFRWGFGADHQLESKTLGKALLKLYYQAHMNATRKVSDLPKGAKFDRYRVLWRHIWRPLPDTTVITDVQKYSDIDFRKELLFREEFSNENASESFISLVTGDPNFTVTGLVRKRINRFQTVSNALPQLTFDVRPQRIGDTQFFSESKLDLANFDTKQAHSEEDTDVIRADWFQRLSYAMRLFRPIEVTSKAGVRQTYYTKDIQGATRKGQRNLFSGQFSMGADASLKLFRIFPVASNALGLNLNWLRHVITPTISYTYVHDPTVPNDLLNFASADGTANQMTFGVENKLQTKRPVGGKLRSVDLARLLFSVPYTFRGRGNKQGGRLGDWPVDLELYPWPWLRVETDWSIPSHFVAGTRDDRITTWNVDVVMVGGDGSPLAQNASDIQAPTPRAFEAGPHEGLEMMPQGQWYLGFGHRYSQNDKTESVLQFDWRPSQKWQIGTFHRLTWKEMAGSTKRFNNVREYQYTLRRDLHDWIGELVYRVDREYGEELFLTLTLKAYPQMPIEFNESYHQPKIGSQSSPFSPIRVQ